MSSAHSSKRRRLTDRTSNTQSQPSSTQRNNKNKYYDPDQDPQERRRLRKGFRDLTHLFNDSRTEYMRTGNNGILETLEKANELYVDVKQTSDATLDSRLLVNAADLSHKRTAQLALGNAHAGLDVDEFVSKCISYMRRGPDLESSALNATRHRRHAATQRDSDDSDEEDNGDAMNWDWLGRAACVPHNARPVVSGWLLGPLSVQKRARQVTQRRGNEQFDATQTVKPLDLQQEDLGQQDSVNLTQICSDINKLLAKYQDETQEKVDEILNDILAKSGEPSPAKIQEVMDEYNLADDTGVPFFKFCINPDSFGQSVENLFYVSFLVRDGTAGIGEDSRGLPTLHSTTPYQPNEAHRQGVVKRQAVVSLDFDTWQELIDVYGIKKPIIPHRKESDQETATTWYGGR
ncbi:hypothetical protein N7478_005487 [Penicillium angulare]|uniref:uncharacterized protein n=1 Tax=Penicillium angulare TaxID=116970 RepID=UPI002541223C|nr:uncharacterized protein N7478_005487 [Penicillium angulare]KAJ5280115.1 hypothetical protein N7478_005487 [Penicillium angulare]